MRGNPTQPIIYPPIHVGRCIGSVGSRLGSMGLCIGSRKLFKYQHIGIGNAKLSRWGCRPIRDLSVSGFALQLNIG